MRGRVRKGFEEDSLEPGGGGGGGKDSLELGRAEVRSEHRGDRAFLLPVGRSEPERARRVAGRVGDTEVPGLPGGGKRLRICSLSCDLAP